MVVEKTDLFFCDALLWIKTCLMDVALVRGWCGVYDVYYAMCDALCKTDGAVKFGGDDRETEWHILWNEYGCRLCDGCVGDDCVYVRVKCRCSGLVCMYDVYATLPDGLYDLNLQNFEK